MRSIRSFTYVARDETGVQDPVMTLRLRSGSCRDFAVLMMEAVRSLGLAARFVSGYLYVPEGRRGERVGGGATHAWLEVYVPGAGWIEFDPTNGIVGNHDLIRVAVARDPRQAVPISGTWTGFPSDHHGMEVEVEVIAESEADADSKPAHNSAPVGLRWLIPQPLGRGEGRRDKYPLDLHLDGQGHGDRRPLTLFVRSQMDRHMQVCLENTRHRFDPRSTP